jgi:hypothetical protein
MEKKDMSSQESFFEAIGPAQSGFRTRATHIVRGVEVAGTELGVKGQGGPGGFGVVGLSAAATFPSDPTALNKAAGVFGIGDEGSAVGVRGESFGPNAGVVGVSHSVAGVHAQGVTGTGGVGVSGQGIGQKSIGVSGAGSTGVSASGTDGPGLQADSVDSQAGVFTSQKRAQIRLVPTAADPGQFPNSEVGDLAVTFADAPISVSLWFCVIGGAPGQAVWKKIV